jgi:hypothetical protein
MISVLFLSYLHLFSLLTHHNLIISSSHLLVSAHQSSAILIKTSATTHPPNISSSIQSQSNYFIITCHDLHIQLVFKDRESVFQCFIDIVVPELSILCHRLKRIKEVIIIDILA